MGTVMAVLVSTQRQEMHKETIPRGGYLRTTIILSVFQVGLSCFARSDSALEERERQTCSHAAV